MVKGVGGDPADQPHRIPRDWFPGGKTKKTEKNKKQKKKTLTQPLFLVLFLGIRGTGRPGGRGPLQKGVCHKNKNKKTPPSGVKPMARNNVYFRFFFAQKG